MTEENKKPKIVSQKDVIQEAGVEEASPEETQSESLENAPEEQPAETPAEEEKKPRVKVVVEPVFGERGVKPTVPIAGERPLLVRELQEQAARDVLPMQPTPSTPLEAGKPLTREEAAQRAHQIWEQHKEEKNKDKLFTRLKRAIGLH